MKPETIKYIMCLVDSTDDIDFLKKFINIRNSDLSYKTSSLTPHQFVIYTDYKSKKDMKENKIAKQYFVIENNENKTTITVSEWLWFRLENNARYLELTKEQVKLIHKYIAEKYYKDVVHNIEVQRNAIKKVLEILNKKEQEFIKQEYKEKIQKFEKFKEGWFYDKEYKILCKIIGFDVKNNSIFYIANKSVEAASMPVENYDFEYHFKEVYAQQETQEIDIDTLIEIDEKVFIDKLTI